MVLLKNPNSIDSKVGEAAALIGLKRTTEAKAILFASPEYQNNAYDNELLGDAYFTDGNYEEATNYYLNATGLYMKPIINETGGPVDLSHFVIGMKLGEIKIRGLYNSPSVIAFGNDTGANIVFIEPPNYNETLVMAYTINH